MGQLGGRVERLEGMSAPPTAACGRCGPDGGSVEFLGLPDGADAPGWIGRDGHCLTCGRLVRVYRGVDLAVV